jgi:hypothetical protein
MFIKLLVYFLHNDTTINQLHIDGFYNLFYVWSSNYPHVPSENLQNEWDLTCYYLLYYV